MTFGEAIEAMKRDECVQREGWNGRNMHIYLEDMLQGVVQRGEIRRYEPVIVMFTADRKHQPGWLASQADMLAMDWRIVPREERIAR